MFFPSGDQSSPLASVAIEVSLCTASHRSRRAIEIRDPNLRAAFFRRDKRKPLPIRRPARTVGVLIGDDLAVLLTSTGRGHDPDVRRLRVGFEIDIDHAEDHPLAVGRNFRLADALELHHVFEGEGMLGLGECGACESNKERERQERIGA